MRAMESPEWDIGQPGLATLLKLRVTNRAHAIRARQLGKYSKEELQIEYCNGAGDRAIVPKTCMQLVEAILALEEEAIAIRDSEERWTTQARAGWVQTKQGDISKLGLTCSRLGVQKENYLTIKLKCLALTRLLPAANLEIVKWKDGTRIMVL